MDSSQFDRQTTVEKFLFFCEAQGLGKDSLRSHRYALNEFLEQYSGKLADITEVKMAISNMLQGKQDAYYNKQLNAIRKFFDYCVEEGIMRTNPALKFKYRRPTIQVVDHSEKTIKAFMQVIDKDTFAGLRDYAFVILMLDCGIRPNEALQIKPIDVDFQSKQIRVRREYAKARKERYLPVSLQVLEVLKKLIAVRPDDWKTDVPILCSFDGHRLPPRGMQDRFRKYSVKIGVEITPYHLRHVFGLFYVRNGGSAFSLQALLGHETLDMTKVYVNLSSEDIRGNHDKASPLKSLTSGKRVFKL